jgi:hypothetical protein
MVAVIFSIWLCVVTTILGAYCIHFYGPSLNYSSSLKMEIEYSPETLVRRHQNTVRHIRIQ